MINLPKPEVWITAKLQDLAILTIGGDWGKDADYEDSDFTTALCIRGAEFRNWNENKGSTASIRKIKKSNLQNRMLINGDILVEISGGGPEQPVGRTVLIDDTVLSFSKDTPKICTNFLRLLRTTDKIDSSYLNSYLTFFYQSGEIRNYQGGSNNLRNLRFNDYLGIDIPIPPISEQHRIIAKIEALFSELDNGIESLKTAREQLKIYRQALLKHAFSGKLTEQWRAENQDKLETAEVLLQRIQIEREQRYQQQLEDWENSVSIWEENGKQDKKPKKPRQAAYSVINNNIPNIELPDSWCWCNLGDIISDLTDYHANGSYENLKENVELTDHPDFALMVRATNFEKNNFHSEQKYITKTAYEFLSKSKLFGNEILIGKIGNAGRVYFMPELHRPASLAMNLFCLRFDMVISKYVYLHLQTEFSKNQISSFVKGVGNPTIDKISIRSLNVALPTVEEQKIILDILEERFSITDQLDQALTTALQQAEALRQSILKKAFSGQLVPQDPNDEPASVLLERIQAEKAALFAQAKKVTQKTKSVKKIKA